MLFEDLDWSDLYRRLPVWQMLSPVSRKTFASLRPSDKVVASRFGEDLGTLVRHEFLVTTQGKNAFVHPKAHPLVRALRFMVRNPVLEKNTQSALVLYNTELLVAWERQDIASAAKIHTYSHEALAAKVSSIDWPRSFVKKKVLGDRASERTLRAAQRLTVELLETLSPMRLGEIPGRLDDLDPEERWTAVNVAIANLVVFPVFLDGSSSLAEPGLTLWPPAVQRKLAPPPDPPPERVAAQSWAGPVLVRDAGAVLMAAAAEPLRIRKNDGALYAKTAEELESALIPLPAWLIQAIEGLTPHVRLERARALLYNLDLLKGRRLSGGRIGLVPSEDASEWFALGPGRQLRFIVDQWRLGEGFADAPEDLDSEDLAGGRSASRFGFHEELDDSVHYFDLGYTGRLRGSVRDLASAIRSAVERVGTEHFVRLDDFLEYEASQHNPLEEPEPRLELAWSWHHDTPEGRCLIWERELHAFVLNRLMMVGGIRIGIDDEGDLLFKLTPVGRYLVGLTDVLELERPDEAGRVVVQPDFDVVFLGPAPETEAAISRFAERRGHGVGILFRLTRTAAYTAAAAGVRVEEVLETLEAASAQPVPENVKHEIRAWFGRARRLQVRRTLVVECESAEVAGRLLAAGGKEVRLIGETVVEIPKGKIGRALAKRAAAKGLFLAPPGGG